MVMNIVFVILHHGWTTKTIGGMTVHRDLGIAIKKRNKGKGNRSIDQDQEDYTSAIRIKKSLLTQMFDWLLRKS